MALLKSVLIAAAALVQPSAAWWMHFNGTFSFSGVSGARFGPGLLGRPTVYYDNNVADYGSLERAKPIEYKARWDTEEAKWPGWNGYAYVLNGDIPVNFIYFTKGDDIESWKRDTLHFLVSNVSGTNWFSTVKKYYNRGYTSGTQRVNSIRYGGHHIMRCDWGWEGKTGNPCSKITDVDVTNIIKFVSTRKDYFPGQYGLDDKAVYVFVVSPNIAMAVDNDNVLGHKYCAYHTTFNTNNLWLKYAVVQQHSNCVFRDNTVNGAVFDSMMYYMMHEVVDTITTPNPPHSKIAAAWSDADSNEVMDKCDRAVSGVRWDNGFFNSWVNGRKFLLPAVFDPEAQACTMNGWFNLVSSTRSNFVVDQLGWGRDWGNHMGLWGYTGTMNQKLRFDGKSLKAGHGDNLCLDVYAFQTYNGAQVVLWGCNGASNQKWNYDPVTRRLHAEFATWMCLHASSADDGAKLVISHCDWSNNQKFTFRNVEI